MNEKLLKGLQKARHHSALVGKALQDAYGSLDGSQEVDDLWDHILYEELTVVAQAANRIARLAEMAESAASRS